MKKGKYYVKKKIKKITEILTKPNNGDYIMIDESISFFSCKNLKGKLPIKNLF